MQDKEFKGIKKYAYGKAMRDIRELFGGDAKRFNKSLAGLSQGQMEARINRVIEFLNAPTSQKKYINLIYSNRFDTLKTKYGITKMQAVDVFERELITKYETDSFNSSIILKLVGKQKSNKKDFDKFLKTTLGKNYHTPKDTESFIKSMKKKLESGQLSEEALLNYLEE